MRALELGGKAREADAVRTRWEEVWKDADVPLSSSCFSVGRLRRSR